MVIKMIKYLLLLFMPVFVFSSTLFTQGSTFAYQGKTYSVDSVYDGQCTTGGTTLVSPVLISGNRFQAPTDIDTGCTSQYYHPYAEISTTIISDTPCDSAPNGLCYQNLCDGNININGVNYINNGITDIETCTSNLDGTPTGNIWRDALDCSAPTGACLQENNCTAPAGYSILTNVTTAASCDAQTINMSLPTSTNMVITDALWQACDTKCYVKSIDIDCASQTPFSPSLQDGETIYSTDLSLQECVSYANTQNMDVRYETYQSGDAPGFSCQDLNFCIVKDRPHSCQGIDIPLPVSHRGETYFLVDTIQQCKDYGASYDLPVRTEHFDDIDNSGQFCYDVNYCVVLPYVDGNGTIGGDPGNDTTTTPDNTGTHSGTGVQTIDLNGTNDRLDIIDGHIKDLSQVNRQGFDRNHDDINQLSQDIKDGSELINRGLNGLSHSIGTVLDHLQNGEINSTGNFDDTRIVQANNNTTAKLSDLYNYLTEMNATDDGNLSDLNLADLNLSRISDVLTDLDIQLDTNLTENQLKSKIEEEINKRMSDFNNKSKQTMGDVLDDILPTIFNPFEPFLTTGSNSSNFSDIDLPITINSIGFTDSLSFTYANVFGAPGSSLSYFYEIMRVLLSFIAVIAGFIYLLQELNNG